MKQFLQSCFWACAMTVATLPGHDAWADSNTPIAMNAPSTPISLVAYRDPWRDARERWWDISSYRLNGVDHFNQFNAWLENNQPNGQFDYAERAAGVSLIYDRAPNGKFFVGRIIARNLKPNFAYQIKLAGKPTLGPRGTGTRSSHIAISTRNPDGRAIPTVVRAANGNPTAINGDDWANQQLGYAGRWWNDSAASSDTNAVTDSVYRTNRTHSIYGYLFLGDFVTDKAGNADWSFSGNRSFHVTWQDWQSASKDVRHGTYNIGNQLENSNPPQYYGYGPFPPSSANTANQQTGRRGATLFYELEPNRPDPIRLASGKYHCRVLITEETFHNDYGATGGELGGRWKTVMATEDFAYNNVGQIASPDVSVSNDVVFTIR